MLRKITGRSQQFLYDYRTVIDSKMTWRLYMVKVFVISGHKNTVKDGARVRVMNRTFCAGPTIEYPKANVRAPVEMDPS